jgi:hypothetical protein
MHPRNLVETAALLTLWLVLLFWSILTLRPPQAAAADAVRESFASPEQAAQKFLHAAETNDIPALTLMFGTDGKPLIESGDAVQDKNQRAAFARVARQALKLQVDPNDDNRVFILTGEDQDPFAVPLIRKGGAWQFDTSAGLTEVLARRIGANELDAISVCNGYVEAQNTYATDDLDGNGVAQYAQKFISSAGKRDGLYWPTQATGPVSPISVRIMRAAAEGYAKPDEKPVPYHGYFYKILKGQGPNAAGGARDYLQQGLMIGGFALVVWPAEYGASGIKTFLVNQDGVVYEKDLGRQTASKAQAMTRFNPDKTWHGLR